MYVTSLKIYFRPRLTAVASRILKSLMTDENALENTLKPLQVSHNSVSVRSADEFSEFANETETDSREKKSSSY